LGDRPYKCYSNSEVIVYNYHADLFHSIFVIDLAPYHLGDFPQFLCSYAMHEMGLASRKPYRKCARVVGEVCMKELLISWESIYLAPVCTVLSIFLPALYI
jgi:hypothetical protein